MKKQFIELKYRVSEGLEFEPHILNPDIIEYVLPMPNDSGKCMIEIDKKKSKRYFGQKIEAFDVHEPYWLVKEKLKASGGSQFVEFTFSDPKYEEGVVVLLNRNLITMITQVAEMKFIFCFFKGRRRYLGPLRLIDRSALCIDEPYQMVKEKLLTVR